MALELSMGLLGRLGGEAIAAHPHECCGILLAEGCSIVDIIPARNVHPAPLTRFEIDPQTLIDAHRLVRGSRRRVIGYYHSHPSGPARPSRTDEAQAAGDGSVWAIIAPGETTFWRALPGGFEPLSYSVADS